MSLPEILVNPSTMIVKYEKQILIFLHHFQKHSHLFSLQKVADSRIFTQIPSTRSLKMKYMTLNLGHTLEYDSKAQTFFFIFCITSTKIPFLPYFQTLQIIKYGPLKLFPYIPFENIHFYVPQNEKKNQNWFFGQCAWFSRVGSQMKK